jgi:hypothetical protein
MSLVIAVVLALQVAATFDLFPRILSRPSHVFWPFMDYPMYRFARYEGSIIERFRVLGRHVDGSEIEVTPSDLGLNFRKFRDILVGSLRAGDVPRVAAFAEVYRVRTGKPLVAMRVERHGHILTRDGLRPAPSVRLAEVPLHTP